MESRDGLYKVSDGVNDDTFIPLMALRARVDVLSFLPRRVLSAFICETVPAMRVKAMIADVVRCENMLRDGLIGSVD